MCRRVQRPSCSDPWTLGPSDPSRALMTDDDDLALMPRSLRDKLDRVGIKLHLKEWQLLTLAERRRLVEQACDSADEIARYRSELAALIRLRTGHEPDLILGTAKS